MCARSLREKRARCLLERRLAIPQRSPRFFRPFTAVFSRLALACLVFRAGRVRKTRRRYYIRGIKYLTEKNVIESPTRRPPPPFSPRFLLNRDIKTECMRQHARWAVPRAKTFLLR